MKIQTQCPKCNKLFTVWAYRLRNGNKPYCSVNCSASAQPHPRKRISLICPVCNKVFERQPNELHHKKHYCSRECMMKDRPHNSQNPTWKRIGIPCETCGRLFDIKRYRLKRTNHFFCSRKCKGIWQSANLIGAEAPHWSGGASRSYLNGKSWHRQAYRARRKANFVCQLCGITEKELGKALDVHHIKPFTSFNSTRKAHSLSNLQALCHNCHMKIEKDNRGIPRFLAMPLYLGFNSTSNPVSQHINSAS